LTPIPREDRRAPSGWRSRQLRMAMARRPNQESLFRFDIGAWRFLARGGFG
jgi:hypothetical protein